jgi:hypothetical protein
MTFGLGVNTPLRAGGIASLKVLAGIIHSGGLGGAIVGVLLWLIARPDRIERETAVDGRAGSE